MVKAPKNDNKSDGIEILSVGKLYAGPWDKKYWSSSRGKDRYPYPVGYKSVRIQDGVTYIMDILEGPKGPLFTISSNDGKSCSGDTPDIAWESFQKRGCSKLWHGKRFSWKLGGVEFFGFKNTLVQRLLRELVTNVGGTAEQNLLMTNFSHVACETIDQLQCNASSPGPDLLQYLVKSHVTRKRNRKNKLFNNKLVKGTPLELNHEQKSTSDVGGLNSEQFDPTKQGSSPPLIEVNSSVCSKEASGPQISTAVMENGDERVMQLSSVDKFVDLKMDGAPAQGKTHVTISERISIILNADELLQIQEPTGKSRNIEVQECNNLITEGEDEITINQNSLPLVTDAVGYAPDTLDYVGDSSSSFSLENKEQGHWNLKDALVNDLDMSMVPATDSLPEDEGKASACGTSSEFCDTDSTGPEIAASMMTVLLPRAVPLLKTFTRKKKKRAKPSDDTTCWNNSNTTHRSLDETRTTSISMNNTTTVRELAKPSDFEVKNENACTRGANLQEDRELTSDLHITSTNICGILNERCKMNDEFSPDIRQRMRSNSKLEGFAKFFSSYVHPLPILTVQLFNKEMEIFICVDCGYSDHEESTLFIYKAPTDGEKMGFPSLIGHVPLGFQTSESVIGWNIAKKKSLLQLAPDGQSLVLLNSIRTSFCSDGILHCSCPACSSDRFEKRGIKIVRLNHGFASLVMALETTQDVCCFLVCELSVLLAAEESGRLNLWIMNSEWSQQKEASSLPTCESMLPCIMELKQVPSSSVLVVGHNGLGEFGLWDVGTRNLVSRFSSPGLSVSECLPANLFRWQQRPECKTNSNSLVKEIMDATRKFSGGSENHRFSSKDTDVGVWLLISTASDPDSQCFDSCEQLASQAKCWKLALLINNMVIIGSVIDNGVAAVTSAGHGIIGRSDGLVYAWELSTGKKLVNLYSFKGGCVSCLATGTSTSGALAIAAGDQLLVYLTS